MNSQVPLPIGPVFFSTVWLHGDLSGQRVTWLNGDVFVFQVRVTSSLLDFPLPAVPCMTNLSGAWREKKCQGRTENMRKVTKRWYLTPWRTFYCLSRLKSWIEERETIPLEINNSRQKSSPNLIVLCQPRLIFLFHYFAQIDLAAPRNQHIHS